MTAGRHRAEDPVPVTRASYDAVATRYAERNGAMPAELAADVAAFAAGLPAGARVADVGCGPGRDLAALRAAGLRVAGLDLSAGQLRAGGLAGVAVADMRRLPVADAALDGLWCQAALLHVPEEDLPAALAGFARVLRAGGLLHLAVAEGSGSRWEADAYGPEHRRWYVYHDPAALADRLAAAGFTVTDTNRRVGRRRWLRVRARRRVAADPGPELARGRHRSGAGPEAAASD